MDVITFPENLFTTSGLSILLHGVISLPDGRSYDNTSYLLLILCVLLLGQLSCQETDSQHSWI